MNFGGLEIWQLFTRDYSTIREDIIGGFYPYWGLVRNFSEQPIVSSRGHWILLWSLSHLPS